MQSGMQNVAAVLVCLPDGASRPDQLPAECRRLLESSRRAATLTVGFGAGLSRLSLAERCDLLLAGLHTLVDESEAGWEARLAEAVGPTLARHAMRCEEESKFRALMSQHGLVASSPAMTEVLRTMMRLAPASDVPVLITGETGTGKEVVARALHSLDPQRCDRPFVAVNCAALPPSLVESELFGYRRGTFSGADRDRKGLIRAAEGGVLMLDEIGDLDRDIQAKILRVLQEHRVLVLGAESEEVVDVRVLAATHRDLPSLVTQGRFREDLFHRLAVVTLHVPPLRERREDIPALVAHFLKKHSPTGVSRTASADFLAALEALDLSGNVRQLENTIRASMSRADHLRPIDLSDLPRGVLEELAEDARKSSLSEPPPVGPSSETRLASDASLLAACGWRLQRAIDECERNFLLAALSRCKGRQVDAAELLGVTRRTVYNKIRRYGLSATDHGVAMMLDEKSFSHAPYAGGER
jgi:DNA-binding NtrC family response regulator